MSALKILKVYGKKVFMEKLAKQPLRHSSF